VPWHCAQPNKTRMPALQDSFKHFAGLRVFISYIYPPRTILSDNTREKRNSAASAMCFGNKMFDGGNILFLLVFSFSFSITRKQEYEI